MCVFLSASTYIQLRNVIASIEERKHPNFWSEDALASIASNRLWRLTKEKSSLQEIKDALLKESAEIGATGGTTGTPNQVTGTP